MDYRYTADWLKQQVPEVPIAGIILGTGLSSLADMVRDQITFPYETVPGFVKSTAPSHTGNLIFGYLSDQPVILYQGRFHYYEGYSMSQVVFPTRVLACMGVKHLIVTNASGSLRKDFEPGDIIMLSDHINFMGTNPLIGQNDDELGERFPSMNLQYDLEMQKIIQILAVENSLIVKSGTYIAVTGPNLETKAECQAFAGMGADLVGMSTVPEVLAARHAKMRVLGFSVVTNYSNLFHNLAHSQEEIRNNADIASGHLKTLISGLLRYLN